MSLGKKDFLSIADHTTEDLRKILELAKEQKPLARDHKLPHSHPNRTMGCVFAKPSLRTRISFETAVMQLGGNSLFITDQEIGIGKRESIYDVAKVMSRFVDAIMIRWYDHDEVVQLAKHSDIPIINGLTDLNHPCQVMGDILTIEEHLGSIDNKTVVMVGDGNNLANSWINASRRFPFNFVIACPEGYEPDEAVMTAAEKDGASFCVTNDPADAVRGAHVIYSDAFYSMGQEEEAIKRRKDFADFRITNDLLAAADPNHIVMHCLPAHRGEEITDEVMDGKHSVVFDEAENRQHAQRAIIALLMK